MIRWLALLGSTFALGLTGRGLALIVGSLLRRKEEEVVR